MKKIKTNVKQWLAKKLHEQLLPYVLLGLTQEQIDFLFDSFYPNGRK